MTKSNDRDSDHDINPLFLNRWSPRVLDGQPIGQETLFRILEAARWAPSASNVQPWRFIYGLAGSPSFDRMLGLLNEGNRVWAGNASVLLFLVSDELSRRADGSTRPNRSHSFDAGASWAMLALQATHLGYQAHAMGGVDFERAQVELSVPNDHRIEAAIAIGRPTERTNLSEEQRIRETPNGRRPLSTFMFEGVFSAP